MHCPAIKLNAFGVTNGFVNHYIIQVAVSIYFGLSYIKLILPNT
jgi:hypothetical protein